MKKLLKSMLQEEDNRIYREEMELKNQYETRK